MALQEIKCDQLIDIGEGEDGKAVLDVTVTNGHYESPPPHSEPKDSGIFENEAPAHDVIDDILCEIKDEGDTKVNSVTLKDKGLSNSLDRSNSSESTDTISSDPSFANTSGSQDDGKDGHNCLSHPAYLAALHQMEEKQVEVIELEGTIQRLKDALVAESKKLERVQELEGFLVQRERELSLYKKEQELERRSFEAAKKEIENKYLQLKKDHESATREKENMVMRYAISEKELIDIKKERDTIQKKMKDSLKEHETLLEKTRVMSTEKAKISQMLDSKSSELSNLHKEIDKLKEEMNSRDIKIKWTQNKLKTEMDLHKECPGQIEKLTKTIQAMEDELTTLKLESQNVKKDLQEIEQAKALERQLKEEQAKLIMERHEHSEIHSKYKSLQQKHQFIIEENNSLSFQVQNLETERLEMEKKLSSSREETEKLSNLVSDLQSKLVEMDSLTSQLKQSEDKVNSLISEIERLRRQNEELLQDMAACRAKESEMLSFTQKLTTKNVQLQSEFSSIETKASDLQKSEEKWKQKIKELKNQVNDLQSQLDKEKARREEETKLLAKQVAEKKKKGDMVEAELMDTRATLTQSKQKHLTMVKELQKELSNLRRKFEKAESEGSFKQSDSMNSLYDTNFIQACELPPQNLVERILKLQNDNAKLAEKNEFLEEHSAHLLSEVQRKSKLLQSYMLREEAGALAPSFVDNHKAEVSKNGGIMASLYGATPQDDGMTLELCLEINRKLQAVLEDTLLKNIMLKENMDTLGDEISRLSREK